MFKSARWRGEKNRIKEVFKLQFHVSQVSQPGVDALTVALVPGDVGKPTLRLEKASVREGSCRWENPVLETVKFVRDPKTGKINERIYHFIVSSGSLKAGVIGEVTIDFADYVEATKASTISLPLKSLDVNSNSNTVLHVSIRRVQDTANDREMEEPEDVKFKPQVQSLKSQFSIGDADDSIKSICTEEEPFNKPMRNTQVNSNSRASSGSDITLSSLESSSGLNTPRELAQTQQDDSTSGSQDTHPRQRSQEQASGMEIEKLKAELAVLARQADMTELEVQTLRKQIVKESKRGQDLSKEVLSLKEERNALKVECEKLKAFQKRGDDRKAINKLQIEGGDVWALLEEIRQELNYEKDLNSNLRIQLQKTQEANTELILAVQDLDGMLEQKDKEITNVSNNANESKRSSSKCETDEDEEQRALEELVKQHVDAKETYMLEQKIVDLYREIDIYRRDKDELEIQMEQLALDFEILKQENHDISYRLEQSDLYEQLKMQCEYSGSNVNVNELESQVESLENDLKRQSKELLDSLGSAKELEGQVESLESELKKQSKELSDYLVSIEELGRQVESLESELKKQSKESLDTRKELESHIASLEEELERQSQGFEDDVEALTRAKVEQEQRAIKAEEALRRTRWKNADTAEKLQEDFRRLSVEMASTFEANEKVAMKALMEARELRMQKSQMEEMLQKANEEILLIRDVKLLEVSDQLELKTNQIEQLLLEIDEKSKQLESQTKHEEEVSEALLQEILILKAEIDRLTAENKALSQQAEEQEKLRVTSEKMRTSIEETEVLIQRGNEERNKLISTIGLLKKEADKSMDELNNMTHLKCEKETELEYLKSELEVLKGQHNNIKDSLFADELEKEKLLKQVVQLKDGLKKKDDALSVLEKKLKDHNARLPVPRNMKEVEDMKEKIELLEGQIKSKETALETSTNLFLEKEKDLLNKIEGLESSMEELNQNSADFCDGRLCQKDELLAELTTLKERNASMESELKEMQERYSELSLKFAEVEGERQRLVMTVRSLKNSKRTK